MVRRVRWPAFLLLSAGAVSATPRSASACSCGEPLPLSEYARRAEVVFVGVVLEPSAGTREGDVSYRFRVTEDIKGHLGTEAIHTWRDTASCGQRFAVGTEYVVFASRDASGTLRTEACLPNQAAGAGGGPSRFEVGALLDVVTSMRDPSAASTGPRRSSTLARERSAGSLREGMTTVGLVVLGVVAGWLAGVRWQRRRSGTK